MTWPLLLELLLKSGVIAAAGLGLSALLAARPARERAATAPMSLQDYLDRRNRGGT